MFQYIEHPRTLTALLPLTWRRLVDPPNPLYCQRGSWVFGCPPWPEESVLETHSCKRKTRDCQWQRHRETLLHFCSSYLALLHSSPGRLCQGCQFGTRLHPVLLSCDNCPLWWVHSLQQTTGVNGKGMGAVEVRKLSQRACTGKLSHDGNVHCSSSNTITCM